MTAVVAVAFVAVLVAYGASTFYYVQLFRREEQSDRKIADGICMVAVALHVVFLVLLGLMYGELPLVGVANFLSFVALSLVLVHWLVQSRTPGRGAGAFVVGIAFVLQFLSWPSVLQEVKEVKEFLRSPLFGVHVLLAIAGYVGFTLSALYGVMYLLQFRALKSMRLGTFFRNLPPLDFLAKMNVDSAIVGIVCLTITIGLGLLLAHRYEMMRLTDAKFIQAVAAWLMYAALLAGHFALRWRGRLMVNLSLVCYALFIAALIIVVSFFETEHTFS